MYYVVLVGGKPQYQGSSFEDAQRMYEIHKNGAVSCLLCRVLEGY